METRMTNETWLIRAGTSNVLGIKTKWNESIFRNVYPENSWAIDKK
jgi:hypothetical protein